MKAQLGFSFLELIIVVGLIGIVATFSISTSDKGVSAQKIVSQAEEAAVKLSSLIASARSSQTSIVINCDSKNINVDYFRLKPSNMLAGSFGTSVQLQTSGARTRNETLLSYSFSSLIMACPAPKSYITSDGNLFTQSAGNFDLIISSTKNTNVQSRILLSKLGYARIYVRDISISANWNEIRR